MGPAIYIAVSLYSGINLEAQAGALPLTTPNRSPPGVSSPETAVEDIALARRLVALGERSRSALPLITAAQILIDNPTIPLGSVDDADAPRPDTSAPKPLNVKLLLSEARALSGSDAALVALIARLDAAARTTARGTGAGPRQRYERIAGGARLIHQIQFVGRQPAVVYVSGDGGTNLELGVYDSQGQLVASDVTRFGDCLVKWVPSRSDRYRVEVRNRDGSPDWYLLITN